MKPAEPSSAPETGHAVRAAALACAPVINDEVAVEQLESGDLLLTYPVVLRPWLERLFRRLGRGQRHRQRQLLRRKVQLDALGTQVWELIDGRRSVGEIVTAFGEAHKLPHREAELSVTTFLRMLGKRGLVAMRAPAVDAVGHTDSVSKIP
jgi:hypothetical protein